MDEKAVVKISADGAVEECAAGADAGECGYKDGKICGKCGAMAVMKKEDGTEAPIEVKRKKPMMGDEATLESDPVALAENAHLQRTEAGDAYVPKPKKKPKLVGMGDEATLEADPANARENAHIQAYHAGDESAPMAHRNRQAARSRRLATMGMKSADVSDEGFLCAIERKMHPNGGTVCATCPGGCAPEAQLPTILEVEGLAEEMFGGKVLDSGYGYNSDLFLVEMQRKDGKVIEVIFDGTSSECVGWQLLNDNVLGVVNEKSALESSNIIGVDEAAEIAVKSIEGEVIAVDADKFEGIDAWVAEINGIDGKSYDVYVGLDGEVLGYDAYTAEEAADIEAEAADIFMKRAYTQDQRDSMAEEGTAMPDGSYPIADEADLRNAIQAFGRASDKEATKAHIIKRAKALGLEDMLPEGWMSGKKDDDEVAVEDDNFLADLMEFELLATEADIDSL